MCATSWGSAVLLAKANPCARRSQQANTMCSVSHQRVSTLLSPRLLSAALNNAQEDAQNQGPAATQGHTHILQIPHRAARVGSLNLSSGRHGLGAGHFPMFFMKDCSSHVAGTVGV